MCDMSRTLAYKVKAQPPETEGKELNFLTKLKENHEHFLMQFRKSPIFKTLHAIAPDRKKKNVFLDYLQTLSNHFQGMVLLKPVLCEDAFYQKKFLKHLIEEFRHNEMLRDSRELFQERFDPVFDSLCVWFNYKMLTLDNFEKIFIVDFIIEASAAEFYGTVYPIFNDMNIKHFQLHAEADQEHGECDWTTLENLSGVNLERLLEIQQQAWGIVEAQYTRLTQLV
jgi:hypothetical protein